MDFDVTIDRELWIGGSDVGAIMNLSPFKTRYTLLLEKAGLKEIESIPTRYTVYGNKIESKIRDYVNEICFTNFQPNRKYSGDLRLHCDGDNGEEILEIKSTSHIFENVNDYKLYLVQLLLYTKEFGYSHCKLAVYHRPDDLSEVFDASRLQVFDIDINDYAGLIDEIYSALDSFRKDLARLKENPLLSEEDFQPTEVVALSNQVLAFEKKLAEYKTLEADYKRVKQQLFEAMQKHDVKTWVTVNGVRITRVDGTEGSLETVSYFDEDRFKKEHPEEYEKYYVSQERVVRGRNGFVKITIPKQ